MSIVIRSPDRSITIVIRNLSDVPSNRGPNRLVPMPCNRDSNRSIVSLETESFLIGKSLEGVRERRNGLEYIHILEGVSQRHSH
jgi:hypothetical protein